LANTNVRRAVTQSRVSGRKKKRLLFYDLCSVVAEVRVSCVISPRIELPWSSLIERGGVVVGQKFKHSPAKLAERPVVVSDQELLEKFVTLPLMRYFRAKLPTLKPEILERRLCELLKFLILVRFAPGRILFPKEIDDLWHYWILQTRQYAELCSRLPGGSLLYHSSNDYRESAQAEQVDRSEAIRRIISFFISYYRNFGPVTEERLECWPPLQKVMQQAGWDINELNAFLREHAAAAPRSLAGSTLNEASSHPTLAA